MANDFPVGSIVGYGGDASVPAVMAKLSLAKWLLCDGSVLKVADYPDLGTLLSSRYGGDGSTTFGVPDLRGLFVRGTDHGRSKDPDDTDRAVGSLEAYATGQPEQPFTTDKQWSDHTHNAAHLPDDNHHTSKTIGTPPHTMNWTDAVVTTNISGEHEHTIGGGEAETRPSNLYIYYLIKFQLLDAIDDLVAGTVAPFSADATDENVRNKLSEDGWMMCDGTSLDQKAYKKLYDMIGTSYGSTDGQFSLPDLRGLFAKAPAGETPVGVVERYKTHLACDPPFTVGEAGQHSHSVPNLPTDTDDLKSDVWPGNNQAAKKDGGRDLSVAGEHTHSILGGDVESRPINMALDFIIKVQ
jgi:microcystin-dependent protein